MYNFSIRFTIFGIGLLFTPYLIQKMYSFYSIIIFIQVFCFYHAYSNRSDYKWYLVIMFFPFIGSVFYLYHHFYSQRSIENLSEGIKTTFVGNYKIDKLEKELKFSETVSKKIELANEHSDVGNYERALELYTSCCIGIYEDDPDLIKKIVKNSFLIQDYGAAIEYGRKIENEISFKNSDERVAYAWSLFNTNNFDAAAENFRSMDVRFSNYKHRLQFAKFLYQTNQKAESLDKLQLLLEEIDSMDNFEKKSKKTIQKEIQNYLNAIK